MLRVGWASAMRKHELQWKVHIRAEKDAHMLQETFEKHSTDWSFVHFDSNFTEVCFWA